MTMDSAIGDPPNVAPYRSPQWPLPLLAPVAEDPYLRRALHELLAATESALALFDLDHADEYERLVAARGVAAFLLEPAATGPLCSADDVPEILP